MSTTKVVWTIIGIVVLANLLGDLTVYQTLVCAGLGFMVGLGFKILNVLSKK